MWTSYTKGRTDRHHLGLTATSKCNMFRRTCSSTWNKGKRHRIANGPSRVICSWITRSFWSWSWVTNGDDIIHNSNHWQFPTIAGGLHTGTVLYMVTQIRHWYAQHYKTFDIVGQSSRGYAWIDSSQGRMRGAHFVQPLPFSHNSSLSRFNKNSQAWEWRNHNQQEVCQSLWSRVRLWDS